MLQLGFENVGDSGSFPKIKQGIGALGTTGHHLTIPYVLSLFYKYKLFQVCTKTIIMESSYSAMLISQLPFLG